MNELFSFNLFTESLLFGPLKILRQYDIAECPHTWFKGTPKCLLKTATSGKGHFFVATQVKPKRFKIYIWMNF